MSATPSTFAGDDGRVPVEVADVLARRAQGGAGMRELVTVLARHRLLLPLLEVPAEQLEASDADPCGDTGTAMAAVSFRDPDGSAVGLAFTGIERLASWDRAARPMPMPATQVAAALVADGGRALVVDVGSEDGCRIVGLGLLRLATGEAWPPPWEDAQVRRAILAALAPAMADGRLGVRLGAPGPGAGEADLEVRLRLPADVDPQEAGRRAGVVAERLAGSPLVRAVLDGSVAVVVE